ncbi:MAG: ATP-binding protein [Candidatus Woesearchaeota archaeon]
MVKKIAETNMGIDFSRIERLDEIEAKDVSVSYVAAMHEIFRERKSDNELERLVKELYGKFVNPDAMDFKDFKDFLENPNNSINGLLYHICGEHFREHLMMERKEFYLDVGQVGVTYDARFVKWIHRITVDMITGSVSNVNSNKNGVTDMQQVATLVSKKDRQKYITRLIERVVTPAYYELLRTHFSMQDVNILLENDWTVTRGVYVMVGNEKNVNVTIEAPLPYEHQLTRYRSGRIVKPNKSSLLLETPYDTEMHKYAGNPQELTIPLYMKFTVYHERGGWLRLIREWWENRRKSDNKKAESMRLRVIHDERYVGASKKATKEAIARADAERDRAKTAEQLAEEQRARADEAEANAREQTKLRTDAERARDEALEAKTDAEHARREAEMMLKRFTHDIGNSLGRLAYVTDNLRIRSENAKAIDSLEQFHAYQGKHTEALTDLATLTKITNNMGKATFLFLDKAYDRIKQESKEIDLEEFCRAFLGLTIGVENNLTTGYGEKKDYNRTEIVHLDFQFKQGDYRTTMHEAIFSSFLYNLLRNSLYATEGNKERRIRLYGEDLNDKNRLIFEDNGCGMEETIRQTLLTENKRVVSAEGTGLGFITIREFVKYHKGSYEIDTKTGEGSYTRIVFDIPKDKINETSSRSKRSKRYTVG